MDEYLVTMGLSIGDYIGHAEARFYTEALTYTALQNLKGMVVADIRRGRPDLPAEAPIGIWVLSCIPLDPEESQPNEQEGVKVYGRAN